MTAKAPPNGQPRGPTMTFDPAVLKLPDRELCAHVLAEWLGYQAGLKGIAPEDVTPEHGESLISATLAMDTDHIDMAGLEKALKAIARGDPERGARLFRAFMLADLQRHRRPATPVPIPAGHIELAAAVEKVRPYIFAAKCEPPLDAMEAALQNAPPPGYSFDATAAAPGGIGYVTNIVLFSDPTAQAPRIEAEARASRVAVQEAEAIAWLRRNRLLAWVADGVEVVNADALATVLKGSAAPARTDVLRAWMVEFATRHRLPKRDDTLKECQTSNGCTYREALAAWKQLPPDFKRKPRQTDRALTGR